MNDSDTWYLKNTFVDHAIACYPQEMCGYLVKRYDGYVFYKATNIHQDPFSEFAISASDYIRASKLGEIAAVVHSHTDATVYNKRVDFSEADKVACEAEKLPWVLVILPQADIKILNPSGYIAPLLGREFCYGVLDCYSLIRDAYASISIFLNDYPRGNEGEWERPEWNLYEDCFATEGFVEVDAFQIRKYDCLLMAWECDRIHHAGVMWDVERNVFIHHLAGRYSSESIYGNYWRDRTRKVVRHKSLC